MYEMSNLISRSGITLVIITANANYYKFSNLKYIYSARNKEINTQRGCCIPLWLRLWPLASSYKLRGEQPGRTMIPKCRRARSDKPVFKRQARRSNPCHYACLRTDSLIFGPHEFNGK